MENPFTKTVGVLGAGQLGKMLAESGAPWNIRYVFLDNDDSSPAYSIASDFVFGSLYNTERINELAAKADVVAYEIEHVNVLALKHLEESGKSVIPKASVLELIQDKGVQKAFFVANNIPTASYSLVSDNNDWYNKVSFFPGDKVVCKSCKGGYDGKGVKILSKRELLKNDLKPFNDPYLIEAYVENARELAVIVACSRSGEMAAYPVAEMEFDPVSNLVKYLYAPANLTPIESERVKNIAIDCIKKLGSAGLFAVEMFYTADKDILANEIAPRPHNSGHHTIEACYTSQYEQLNRILLGLPLGSTELIMPSVMFNLIGPNTFNGAYEIDNLAEILKIEGVYLHLYGKKECRPDRKMGHITILGLTQTEVIEKSEKVKALFSFVPQK